MQFPSMLALIALLASACTAASRADSNPLEKTVELLDSLSAKIAKEGEAEVKAYEEFVAWCDDASTNKKFEIKEASAKKAKLEAVIGKQSANVEGFETKIEELAASLSTSAAQLKSAAEIRKREAKDFAASELELVDTIETLGRALSVIEREMAKNPAAFAQMETSNTHALLISLGAVVDAAAFTSADREKLVALVQAHEGDEAGDGELGAPAAAAYKSHSAGIVDVLEDLKDKAEEELSGLRKAEASSKHSYAMLRQSLEDQTSADTKDLEDEKAAKASAEETKATATGELEDTAKDLADSESALKLANENCMQTAADQEASKKSREAELKVIAQAKKILADSTGGAAAQSYSLVQLGRVQAATRLRTRADLARAEVVSMVRKLAREHHSAALAQLASRIAAVMKLGASGGADPFVKVKAMLNDLIGKLEAEAGHEADEKAYCDEQLAKTEQKKGELQDDSAKLAAKIDQATARSASLKAGVRQLEDELSALARQQAEMDTQRQDSHHAFVQAKADLEAGLQGVRRALGLLRDYYGSGDSAELLQDGEGLAEAMRQPAMPVSHSKASGAGSSIIGVLEVVESDFAKNLVEEETAEDNAQAEYDKMSQENKLTKARKDQDVKYQTKEFNALDKTISDLVSDRDTMDAELSAVLEYYSKVQERCVAKPETYEARKARREAEIKGLKEAMAILKDETAFTQTRKRAIAGHAFLSMPGQ